MRGDKVHSNISHTHLLENLIWKTEFPNQNSSTIISIMISPRNFRWGNCIHKYSYNISSSGLRTRLLALYSITMLK